MLVQRAIWAAIAASTAIYALIIFMIAGNPQGPLGDAFRAPLIVPLYIMAAIAFVAGLIVPAILRTAPDRLRMIMALAIFESSAVFGLMAAFLGHDWRLYVAPWVLALVGFSRVFPTGEPAIDSRR